MIGRAPGIETRHETLYRVNLSSGGVRIAAPRGVNRDTIDFLLDERGGVIARVDSDRATNRWQVFAYDGEAPRLLTHGVSNTGAPISLHGLLADGRIAAMDWDAEEAFWVLYAIDRATGAAEIIYRREGASLDGTITDPWTRRVVGVTWTDIESEQHFFDPAPPANLPDGEGRISARLGIAAELVARSPACRCLRRARIGWRRLLCVLARDPTTRPRRIAAIPNSAARPPVSGRR